MKKTLLSILSFITITAAAQPIIQSTNFMPVGFSCDIAFSATVAPGPSGANQTWNFTGLTPSPSGSFVIANASGTPCGSTFPTSNWAEIISGPSYNYYLRSASQLEVLAENIPSACSGGGAITYSNSKIAITFPFAYNNSISDPYVSSAGSGTCTTTYDAYGTIIVPTGTITNVARLKIVDGSNTMYEWIATGNPGYPVMLIQSNATIYFSNPQVGVREIEHEVKFSMYPNPAANALSFDAPLSEKQEVFIYNVSGQVVLNKKISGQGEVDLNSLPDGVYSVTVKNETGVGSKKLVIVR